MKDKAPTQELQRKNILVDLDSLLDTRLPLAFIYDRENFTKEWMDSKGLKYVNRISDTFGNISADIFRQLYNKRTKHVLKYAEPTEIIGMLNEQFEEYAADPKTMQLEEPPYVIINIYPYELTMEEQYNLAKYLEQLMPTIEFEFIYKSIPKLTPNYVLDNHIGILVMYDILLWLEYNVSHYDLYQSHLLNVNCLGPNLVIPRDGVNKLTKEVLDSQARDYQIVTNLQLALPRIFSIREESPRTDDNETKGEHNAG